MTNQYNGLEILNFHPAHCEVSDLTDFEAANFRDIPEAFQRLVELNKKSTQAVTIMQDGRILMMCGFIVLWKGVAEVWLIPTKYMAKSPFTTVKTIKKFIEMTAETMNLHRLQAQAMDDDNHNKFMFYLEFEREGTLRNYTPKKENYNQWARLLPERTE